MTKRDRTFIFLIVNYTIVGISYYRTGELTNVIGMVILAVIMYADTFFNKEEKK